MPENLQTTDTSRAKKQKALFLQQKKLLNDFLSHGAITQAQYDKSFGDLMLKMGFDKNGNTY